jgi:hypothetical protein
MVLDGTKEASKRLASMLFLGCQQRNFKKVGHTMKELFLHKRAMENRPY